MFTSSTHQQYWPRLNRCIPRLLKYLSRICLGIRSVSQASYLLPHRIREMYFKSDFLVISGTYACEVIGELAIGLLRGLWRVAQEEVLGPTQHPLVGTPAILVSNQTEIRGYSDNGHDFSVLCSSLYMYSAFANSCPLQTDTFLFPLIHSHNVILPSNKF